MNDDNQLCFNMLTDIFPILEARDIIKMASDDFLFFLSNASINYLFLQPQT